MLGVVVGVLALIGIGIAVLVNGLRSAAENFDPVPDTSTAELDELRDRCADEDWQACDDLYFESPVGSDYEEFGDTCGNRTDGDRLCVDELGGGDAAQPTEPGTEPTEPGAEPTEPVEPGEPQAYGDDPALDALHDACAGGDGAACDQLYADSPIGSEYESFGDTCGGTTDGSTSCAPDPGAGSGTTYGTDPELDALWDACAGGDNAACDTLYLEAPIGSEYETFGDTCGGRTEGLEFCDQ